MLARAHIKYVRMSARKARFVMVPLRNRTVAEALTILATTNRRAAGPISKAIASAFANAKQHDPALGEDQVIISRLVADGGPVWKRYRAAAFGRAAPFRKRTSHLIVELDRLNGRRLPPVTSVQVAQPNVKTRRGKAEAVAAGGGKPMATARKKGRS